MSFIRPVYTTIYIQHVYLVHCHLCACSNHPRRALPVESISLPEQQSTLSSSALNPSPPPCPSPSLSFNSFAPPSSISAIPTPTIHIHSGEGGGIHLYFHPAVCTHIFSSFLLELPFHFPPLPPPCLKIVGIMCATFFLSPSNKHADKRFNRFILLFFFYCKQLVLKGKERGGDPCRHRV